MMAPLKAIRTISRNLGYEPMFSGNVPRISGMNLGEKISTIPETWACCPGIRTLIKKLFYWKSALTISDLKFFWGGF